MKYFIVLLAICVSYISYTQKKTEPKLHSEIVANNPYPEFNSRTAVFYKIDDELFAVKVDIDKGLVFTIQKFSGDSLNLKVKNRVVLDIKIGTSYEGVYKMGNNLYVLIANKSRGTHEFVLKAYQINKQDLSLSTAPVELLHALNVQIKPIDYENEFIMGAKMTFLSLPRFYIGYSVDSSTLNVSYIKEPTNLSKNRNKTVFGFFSFNSLFIPVLEKEVEMPYLAYDMVIKDFIIDKSGNAYVLALNFLERNLKESNVENESLIIIKVDKTGYLKEIPIPTMGKFMGDLILKECKNGEIVCLGFYSNVKVQNKYVYTSGIFISRLDQSGAIISTTIDAFTPDFCFKYPETNAEISRTDVTSMFAYRVLEARELPDSEFILLADIKSIHITKGGFHDVNFKNPIGLKLSNTGKMVWQHKMPRNTYYVPLFHCITDECSFFIYKDNPMNEYLEVTKKPYTMLLDYIVLIKIDNDTGEKQYVYLCKTDKLMDQSISQFSTSKICVLNDKKIIMEFNLKNKMDRLFQFTF